MAFTDHCDIFSSVHEEAFNRIIGHVQRQRPSLFNYGTADVARNRELWCKAVEAHPIVFSRSNPLFTIVEPLVVPGSNFGLNFLVQLAELRIDFHRGDEFGLPPELRPLKPQRLAIKLTMCAGIGCPPAELADRYIPPPEEKRDKGREPNDRPPPRPPIVVLPTRKIHCFCVDAFVTGGVRIAEYNGKHYLEPFLDGFELVDIKPSGLENSLECYITMLLKLVVLPGLRILLRHAPLNLTQGATDLFPQPTNVILSPTPTSGAVPNNPAIEDDQLKAFIDVTVV